MPKPPPYYARVTLRVTLTQFLRTSQNIQVDYDYSYGQEGMRHYGTFRITTPIQSGHREAIQDGFQSMFTTALLRRLESDDLDVVPSLAREADA